MATIDKRQGKNGVSYRIKVSLGYDDFGKQIIRSKTWKPEKGMTARQAEKEANRQAVLFEDRCRAMGMANSRSTKFKDIADEWIETSAVSNLVKQTTTSKRIHLKASIYSVFGNKNISDINYRAVQRYINNVSQQINHATGRPYSHSYIMERVSFISGVFKYAKASRIVDYNPCNDVSIKKDEVKEKNIYSVEEEKMIIKAMESDNQIPLKLKFAIHILIYYGLRSGELSAIRYDDFDFLDKTLTVNESVTKDKDGHQIIGTPKTRSSYRTLPLMDITIEKLKQIIHEDNINLEEHKKDLVFSLKNRHGKVMLMNVFDRFRRVCCKHNLPFKGLHAFRHSFATRAVVKNGIDIKTVAAMMGHANPVITLKTYSHRIKNKEVTSMNILCSDLENTGIKTKNKDQEDDNEDNDCRTSDKVQCFHGIVILFKAITNMQNIINAFVSQASSVAFRQWVSDGKKVPMEDAIQIVGTLLEKGVQAIIRPDMKLGNHL